MTTVAAGSKLELPDELLAHDPPEARGLERDQVKLMVSDATSGEIVHTTFRGFPDLLDAGDVLVVNASATINAAVDGIRIGHDGPTSQVTVHFSSPVDDGRWVVELRRRSARTTSPLLDAEAGEVVLLRGGQAARLVQPYITGGDASTGRVRLWIAEISASDVMKYLERHGSPIRYAHVPEHWPLAYYETLFGTEPGSAEMPSAARPFTPAIVDQLARKGVRIAPIVLHAGVSSLESHEPPYPERYRVPAATAAVVNGARALGGRVVAVGTTAVRALETVAREDGEVVAGEGWTDLVITPERGLFAVDALLTGLHTPEASHLLMLEALASSEHIEMCYRAARERGYLWHEFGDSHLLQAVPAATGRPSTLQVSAALERAAVIG
jgi:S-adenosylmethionine:tRNA ribosyltransferase-isomerase